MIGPYVLASIIERVGGFASRKRLQRYFYFLERLSGSTGFGFELNTFGPYSHGLSLYVDEARRLRYLEEEIRDDIGFLPVTASSIFIAHRRLEEKDRPGIPILDPYEEQLNPVLTASHDLLDRASTLQYFFSRSHDIGFSAMHDPIADAQRHRDDLWEEDNLYKAIDFLRKVIRNDNPYVRPTTDPEPNL